MSTMFLTPRSTVNDFQRAHRQAALQQIVARLRGKPIELLSYEQVAQQLRLTGRAARGLQTISLAAIVGTVGRCSDFTRSFLPRKGSDERRWASLKAFIEQHSIDALPPIEVYQIGTVYFVQDGHHRVSIARQLSIEFITAYVTEVQTRVPLSPDAQPDELIFMAEYAVFLDYTHLDRLRPGADLRVSVPGQYAKLEDHIEVYRYFSEVAEERELSLAEAVCRWYDEAYQPIAEAIHAQGILREFPDRTAADFYIWIAEQRLMLQHELGWEIPAEAATAALATRFSAHARPAMVRAGQSILNAIVPAPLQPGPQAGQWRKTKLAARYSDCLFREILVPISGASRDWCALDQAVLLAQQECSQVHGLWVVNAEPDREGEAAQQLGVEFEQRCKAAGIEGTLTIEVGHLAVRVCERASLADLVVIARDRSSAGPAAEFQVLIRRCTRPVWAVPDCAVKTERALLAYDGGAKSKEALFVAAYFAEQWKTQLTVATVFEHGRVDRAGLRYAWEYLELHEICADFVQPRGPVAQTLLELSDQKQCDVIIMGSYCSPPAVEAFIGGTVDRVLRESSRPVLVCK